MLAIDTNIVVRLLVADDPVQAEAARSLIGREDVLVSSTVLLEAEWVLRSAYDLDRSAVLQTLSAFCGLPHVVLAEPDRVAAAIAWALAGLDFADALHLAGAAGCEAFVTFDRRLFQAAARAPAAPAVRLA